MSGNSRAISGKLWVAMTETAILTCINIASYSGVEAAVSSLGNIEPPPVSAWVMYFQAWLLVAVGIGMITAFLARGPPSQGAAAFNWGAMVEIFADLYCCLLFMSLTVYITFLTKALLFWYVYDDGGPNRGVPDYVSQAQSQGSSSSSTSLISHVYSEERVWMPNMTESNSMLKSYLSSPRLDWYGAALGDNGWVLLGQASLKGLNIQVEGSRGQLETVEYYGVPSNTLLVIGPVLAGWALAYMLVCICLAAYIAALTGQNVDPGVSFRTGNRLFFRYKVLTSTLGIVSLGCDSIVYDTYVWCKTGGGDNGSITLAMVITFVLTVMLYDHATNATVYIFRLMTRQSTARGLVGDPEEVNSKNSLKTRVKLVLDIFFHLALPSLPIVVSWTMLITSNRLSAAFIPGIVLYPFCLLSYALESKPQQAPLALASGQEEKGEILQGSVVVHAKAVSNFASSVSRSPALFDVIKPFTQKQGGKKPKKAPETPQAVGKNMHSLDSAAPVGQHKQVHRTLGAVSREPVDGYHTKELQHPPPVWWQTRGESERSNQITERPLAAKQGGYAIGSSITSMFEMLDKDFSLHSQRNIHPQAVRVHHPSSTPSSDAGGRGGQSHAHFRAGGSVAGFFNPTNSQDFGVAQAAAVISRGTAASGMPKPPRYRS